MITSIYVIAHTHIQSGTIHGIVYCRIAVSCIDWATTHFHIVYHDHDANLHCAPNETPFDALSQPILNFQLE